jgi:hypothetical protein
MAKQLQSTKSASPAAGDGEIVSPAEQAKSNLAKIEAIHTAAAAACAAAGERADQDAYRAAIGELSADEADAAAEEHKRALRDLERAKRALGTAKTHLDEAEDAARRQAQKDRRALLEHLLGTRAEAHAGLAQAIEAAGVELQRAHEADAAVDRFFGGAAPAGSMLSAANLVSMVSLEFARHGPGDPRLGGQKESSRLALPGAATRTERARANIEGRSGSLAETIAATNAYMMRSFEAGGVGKVTEPVDAKIADNIGKLPRAFQDHAAQQLGSRAADQPLSVGDVIRLGYDPADMSLGPRPLSDLMAEHQQRNPKINMAVYRPTLPLKPVAVETPSSGITLVGHDPATLARVSGVESVARQTKNRASLRQLRDQLTGIPGATVDAIPLDRADAFIDALAGLPDAKPAEPDVAAQTPVRPVKRIPSIQEWTADDDS